MGVPGYFAYARRLCRSAVKAAGDGGIPAFAVLYVDFNCLVHNAVRPGADASEVVQGALRLLDRLADEVDAPEVVVCADGVCPEAKMAQQRNRRFMAVKRAAATGGDGPFDRNVITPGTDFMRQLDKEVGEALEGRTSRAFDYSGSDVPGEGEQKIVEDIRKRRTPGETACVYGLDADLVLLCACLKAQGRACPWLCREEAPGGPLTFVDAAALVQSASGGQEWNHVVCSFLCGNDFLPPLSCLDVSRDLGKMREACHRHGLKLVADGGASVNWPDLASLLDILAGSEDAEFRRADAEYWAASPPPSSCPLELWDSYPVLNKDERCRSIRPGQPDWRTRYYLHLFGARSPSTIARVCAEYARGISWTFDYYRGAFPASAPAPAWSYGWEYGPTSADLAVFVAERDPPPSADLSGLPRPAVSPGRLLAFVTPQGSNGVLPPALRARGPRHLFPDDAKIATYLRKKAWHCRAVLPRATSADLEL
jgi:5'-3' exonuclease